MPSGYYERKPDMSLISQRFGRLIVLDFAGFGRTKTGRSTGELWRCKCDCGNGIVVRKSSLISGHTKSCGCFNKDAITKHGLSKTPLYKAWDSMKQRCYNPNHEWYGRYGGRGITMCDEWVNSFDCFKDWATNNNWETGLTLDRIDNDGVYSPDNCRWVHWDTQQNNRSTNRLVTYNSETHTIAEWAKKFGVMYVTLWARINRGNMCDFETYFASSGTN